MTTTQRADGVVTPLSSPTFTKTIQVNAPPARVWAALTKPELMQRWMAEPETELAISTDWRVGSPIVIRGNLHRINFVNTGDETYNLALLDPLKLCYAKEVAGLGSCSL